MLEIKIIEHGKYITFCPEGELDASTSIQMDEAMNKYSSGETYNFLINCSKLEYISSAGLGVFISYLEPIRQHQGKIVFTNMSPRVLNIFQVLGLDKIVTIVSTSEEGVLLFR